MEKKRSVGVTAFGYWEIVSGIFGIFLPIITGLRLVMLFAPLSIVVGIGLLKLKEWARKLTIYLYVLGYLVKLIVSFWTSKDVISTLRYMFFSERLIALLIVIIIVYFFTRSKVKEQFR